MSNSIYTPDKWQILDMGNHKRVFGVWSGGYLSGDSWKLSSGIEGIHGDETHWILPQTSGSVYYLHKLMEGSTVYGMGIMKQILEVNPQAKRVTIEDVLNDYK